MGQLIVFIIICLLPFIKKVPPNTAVIIDRNGHYLKTKRHGYYFLFPSDKVTTTISTKRISRTLGAYYETDDGHIVQAVVNCSYHAHNINEVLQSLSNVRRSVDDIIQSAAYFAINNYKLVDIMGAHNHEFSNSVRANLTNEFNSMGLSLSNMQIRVFPSTITGVACFRPHESGCYRDLQNPHKHDKSLMIGDKFTNGPIIYK